MPSDPNTSLIRQMGHQVSSGCRVSRGLCKGCRGPVWQREIRGKGGLLVEVVADLEDRVGEQAMGELVVEGLRDPDLFWSLDVRK